jgi:hypothetical protein
MRQILFFLLCLCAASILPAQTYTGKVTDEKNQPLPYANVVLLSLPDSAFVTGTVSDESGAFALKTNRDNLLLRISSIGYATIYNKVEKPDLGTIQLLPDAQLLGEVVVKGDLPKVQLKGDAQVTNVTGTILEKAGTGNDLLSKLPGVSAEEGTVNVFGSGEAEIYINGRKMRNASELDQLSSDNVKRVEMVRNPGARYDATVKAVVRIYTKKAQGEGFGFNNRAYVRYQYGWSVLDQFNFNYRKGGFDFGGMLFGSHSYNEDNKILTTETYLDKYWKQVNDIHSQSQSQNFSARLSLNYQFNENHSMGARYEFDRTPKDKWSISPMYSEVFQSGELYEQNTSNGWQKTPATTHSFNVYYNGQIGEWNVDFNADGMWSYTKNLQDMNEQYLPADGIWQEQNISSYNKDENTLYAAKLIVSRPLWGGNFSFGGEYTYTDRVNTYVNYQGILADDDSNIEESAASAFLEYARSFGKLQAQVGVRYEHITSDYYEDDIRVDGQSRTYDNVFPTVSFSLPVGKTQLSLSYTGSIERPSYWDLRSNVTYANRYTYESGNPLLQPSLINRLSLDASWEWIYFNARYTHTKDVMIQTSAAYSDDDPTITLLIHDNKYNLDNINATLSFSPVISVWSPRLTLMYLQQWYKVDMPNGKRKNFNNPIGSFTWNNNFRLPLGFMLDVDFFLQTTGEQENYHIAKTVWSADFGLRKTFFNERFSLQLQATNLFNSKEYDGFVYSGNRILGLDQQSRRRFTLTLRYKFNATKSKYKGTGAGQEQRSRM